MTRFLIPALVLIGLFGLAVRFVDLESNPPSWLSQSAALYIDEGYKLHSARNQVMFGAPTWSDLDEYDGGTGRQSILRSAVLQVFRSYGVHLHPVRVLVAMLGCLSVLCLGCLIGWRFGWRWGIGAAAFLSLDFVHIMFSRRALLEVPQALCAVLVLGGLLGQGPAWLRAGLAILGLALAYLTKVSAVLWLGAIIPGALLYLAVRGLRSLDTTQRNRRLGQLVLAGTIAVVLAYLLLLLAPGVLEHDWGERSNVAEPGSILTENLLSTLARFDPILVGAGLISSAFLLLRPLVAATPAGWLLLGSWGLFGHIALMVLNYNPLRYHLFLVPVFICTTVVFAYDAGRTGFHTLWSGFPRWARVVLCAVLFYAGASAAGGLCHLLGRKLPIGNQPGLTPASSMLAGTAAALAAAVLLLARRNRGESAGGRLQPGWGAALICVSLAATISLGELGVWWAYRSRSISEASERIGAALPPEAIVAGPWAPMLCFETPARTLYSMPGLNEANLPQIRPTHFLFVNTIEGEYIRDLVESGQMSGLSSMTEILQATIDERRHIILYSFEWDELRGFN